MAKRQNDPSASKLQTPPVLSRPQGPAEEARNRLGITPKQMRGAARIAPVLQSVEGGVERAIEALRFAREDDGARAFLRKYDSVPPADRAYLSIDEVCVATGVDPGRMLTVAVDWMVKISVMKTQIDVFSSLPSITRALINSALTEKGTRAQRLFFEIIGILPTARHRGSSAAFPKTRVQKTDAQPAARPAGSPEVLRQPWLHPLPGKLG